MSEQRDKILASACELYLRGGLEGFSMRKLAKSVGVTAPALYRHYENKEELLFGVVVEAYERLAQYLYRGLQGGTATERFDLAAAGYLDFALEQPRLYEVLFSAEVMGMEDPPAEVEAQACAIGQFWNDRVRECMDAGVLRQGDPEAVGVTMWAHAHGLISLYLTGALQVSEATFRELYCISGNRVMRGVGTPEHSAELQTEFQRPPSELTR